MSEQQSEVRPLVQTMPGSEAFLLQTGGSARRRSIKPTGSAPTITFRVSGVPGHTHNASAVASVICDLERGRGFTHTIDAAWADVGPVLQGAHLGDSDAVLDEDARFDRAIERAVGEITLIPENCHQEIREPTRSIAEIRQLVAPQDKLRTLTYVEEVGGFVDPATKAVYISDYADILVDMIGQVDLDETPKETIGAGEAAVHHYTADVATTPVSIRAASATRAADGTGIGYHFVVLRDGDSSMGTHFPSGESWNGIVPFRWVQAEKRYRSEPFTVILRRTVEVGPRPAAFQSYDNKAASPLTVTFPAMQTTVASSGYCFLISEEVDTRTVLLGATRNNGSSYRPEIQLLDVQKPSIQTVSKYKWVGPPAYRFVVGGSAALPGPLGAIGPYTIDTVDHELVPYFERLRNMTATNLAVDMRAEFLKFLMVGAGAVNHHGGTNWAAGNTNNLNLPTAKFNTYFTNLNLQSRWTKFPAAGLPRNAYEGSTWYPLTNAFPTVTTCQQVLAYDGTGTAATGSEVVRKILLGVPGLADIDAWKAQHDSLFVSMNQESMQKKFDQNGVIPPGISSYPGGVVAWMGDVDQFNEAAQQALEDVQHALIAAARAVWEAAVQAAEAAPEDQALQDAVPPLLAIYQNLPAHAELARLISLRIPQFDEWYSNDYRYTGKVNFRIHTTDAHKVTEDGVVRPWLRGFPNKNTILKKMMMVRQRIAFHKATAVQGFEFDDAITHTKAPLQTEFYHLLCDTEIRATGSIKELFELKSYIDVDDGNAVKEWHVRGIALPTDARAAFAAAVPGGAAADAADALITDFWEQFLTMGVGNALEVRMPLAAAVPGFYPQLIAHGPGNATPAVLLFQDLAFGFESPRLFFLSLNNIGHKDEDHETHVPSVFYFSTSDCTIEAREHLVGGQLRTHVCTRVTNVKTWDHGAVLTSAHFIAQRNAAHGNMRDTCCLCQMGPEFQELWFGADSTSTVFDAIREESRALGPVFRSQRRISQHLCAPILNPDARLQCSAPLNYETRHLPPELRDFVLRLGHIDWSFLPGKITMEPLTLYEFNGGNQKSAGQDSLLHLPQFREGSWVSDDGKFDFEVFSPYGMPSYIAIFARDTNFSINYQTQPLVTQLSIMCNTTMKKSNTILDADVHQLFHITQRNVHPRAEYDRFDFNKRQVILLRAEDIGLLGLHASEYQYEKRARFRFQGSVDQVARVTALLIFNNRGLYVHGKQLSVERLVRR